jgi:hypothetical protein
MNALRLVASLVALASVACSGTVVTTTSGAHQAAPPNGDSEAPAASGGESNPAPSPGAPSSGGVAKKPLAGLVDMQNIAWHNTEGLEPTLTMDNVNQFPGVFGGVVISPRVRTS